MRGGECVCRVVYGEREDVGVFVVGDLMYEGGGDCGGGLVGEIEEIESGCGVFDVRVGGISCGGGEGVELRGEI